MTDGTPFSSQTSRKSCEAEPRVLPSQSLLQEDDPEPPCQQLQAAGSRGSEPRSNLDLSRGPLVALEYLPFFRTYGQLLAEEELAPRPEVCRDRGGDQSIREEDSEPPSGFFPYYRSKEERFPSLALPGRWCAGSRDPPAGRELQACCCCRTTVSGRCSVSWGGHRGRRVHCPRAPHPRRLDQAPEVGWGSWSSVLLDKGTEPGGRLPQSQLGHLLRECVLSLMTLSFLIQDRK